VHAYQTLGVAPTASADEIKRAFRKIAMDCHPDRHPDDAERAERFKAARAAYEALIDPERRAVVDRELSRQRAQRRSATDAFYRHTGKAKPGEESTKSAAPPPGAPRTSAPPPARPTAGSDVQARVTITAELAAKGGPHEVVYSRLRPMPGWVPGARGRSTERAEQHTTIDLPPGVTDGATLRFASLGNAGQNGGPNGDLLVRVRVQPATRERKPGPSAPPRPQAPMPLPLSVFAAMLGGGHTLETPDGPYQVVVPPGTQSGSLLPSSRAGQPGPDAVVHVHVPPVTDPEVRAWVKALADRVLSGQREA
jgi:DnaJ-class molecular chaperone